jgi:hypothetical protein
MTSFETEPPPAGPSGKARRRAGAFIAAFVLLQFLIPLSYLGRQDTADERFTWRSFTGTEPPACDTSASLERLSGEREPISLRATIHPDWLEYVAQNRRAVVDAFLERQCEADDVLAVELVNRCEDARGVHAYNLRCGGGRPHETVRTATR